MKTSELLVEPLLIGFVVLVTLAFLGWPKLEDTLFTADLGNLAPAAVAAYFAGVVFDRFADTLLDPLYHHHRLRFALRELAKSSPRPGDPFPEDQYYVGVMRNEIAWEYAASLRSRIRLTRALLVIAPALGVAIALRVTQPANAVRFIGVAAVLWVYLLAGYSACRPPEQLTTERFTANPAGRFSPPRTGDLADKSLHKWYVDRYGDHRATLSALLLGRERWVWLFLLLAAVAGAIPFSKREAGVGLSLAATTVIALSLLMFCWWRMTETFFLFLRDFARFGERPAGKTGSAEAYS